MNKVNFKKEELNKTVTVGALLEYTDEFLLPRISDVVKIAVDDAFDKMFEEKFDIAFDKKAAELSRSSKEHLDKKFDDYLTDTFKRLDKKAQKENQFKVKVVELFKKHKIGSSTDLAFLEGLVSGS